MSLHKCDTCEKEFSLWSVPGLKDSTEKTCHNCKDVFIRRCEKCKDKIYRLDFFGAEDSKLCKICDVDEDNYDKEYDDDYIY